jgi:hemerythrin
MTYFEWNTQVELEHPLLNEQHKHLFALSEALVHSMADAPDHRPAEAALRALIDYAREHFAMEEGLMLASGYTGADTHSGYHAKLLADLEDYCSKIRRDESARLTVTGLVAYLWRWLVLHIDSSDRELVHWLKSQEQKP